MRRLDLTDEERRSRQLRQQAAWYSRNRSTQSANMRAYYRANRAVRIAYQQDRYYGIQDAMGKRAELWTAQQARCKICGRSVALTKGEGLPVAHLDHDHETGQLRGILCPQCNAALGCFNEDVQLLQAAIAYLQEHRQEETSCSVNSSMDS